MIYNYDKVTDLDLLTTEIEASSLTGLLDYISKLANANEIYMDVALDAEQETTLDDIVAAHTP